MAIIEDVTIGVVLTPAAGSLRSITGSPAREARLLLAHVLQQSSEWIFTHSEHSLTKVDVDQFNALLNRRLAHEPLSRILGTREFYGASFHISSAVLDPRPDSETLIEALLEQCPDQNEPYSIADLGTGSGCLLLTALRLYPNATGIGIDYSGEALAIAQQNLQHHAGLHKGLIQRTMLVQGDWGVALAPNSIDILISNPPYIAVDATLPAAVAQYDPALALFAGNNGLDCYEKILATAKQYLKPQATLLLELGAGQRPAVEHLAKAWGFLQIKSYHDLNGIERALVLKSTASY